MELVDKSLFSLTRSPCNIHIYPNHNSQYNIVLIVCGLLFVYIYIVGVYIEKIFFFYLYSQYILRGKNKLDSISIFISHLVGNRYRVKSKL